MNNFILFSIHTLQFYKALNGVRRLLNADHLEDLNANLFLKLADTFIKKFINNEVH